MATLRRIREKVHQPIYDSIFVKPKTQLRETEATGTLKFFVKVQGKTKLETNLDSIPYDSFEVRGMHVVISDLEPEYAEETLCKGEASRRFHVTDKNGNRVSRMARSSGLRQPLRSQSGKAAAPSLRRKTLSLPICSSTSSG
jgi:hypothetical protein